MSGAGRTSGAGRGSRAGRMSGSGVIGGPVSTSVAELTVSRVPGSGYQVTEASGSMVDRLRPRAIDLLERLEDHLGAAGGVAVGTDDGYHVVVVRRGDAEIRFDQSWFTVEDAGSTRKSDRGDEWMRPRRLLRWGLAIVGAMVVGGWIGRGGGLDRAEVAAVEADAEMDRRVAAALRSSRRWRSELTDFLSTPGLAADRSATTQRRRRSVALIDDRDVVDHSPPSATTIRTLRWSNLRVRELLEGLSDFQSLDEPFPPADRSTSSSVLP